jgi:hypothetical protein
MKLLDTYIAILIVIVLCLDFLCNSHFYFRFLISVLYTN